MKGNDETRIGSTLGNFASRCKLHKIKAHEQLHRIPNEAY